MKISWLGARSFEVADARTEFLPRSTAQPIPNRSATSSAKNSSTSSSAFWQGDHFLDTNWILGQGTIYPDTIESGGTAKAELIKTHHNRVAGIQRLIAEGRIIEPLSSFYKDEVRAIGRQLGLAPDLLDRHPFPGPGLAIRCLCSESTGRLKKPRMATLFRSAPWACRAIRAPTGRCWRSRNFQATDEEVAGLINKLERVNRVVAAVWTAAPMDEHARRSQRLSRRIASICFAGPMRSYEN